MCTQAKQHSALTQVAGCEYNVTKLEARRFAIPLRIVVNPVFGIDITLQRQAAIIIRLQFKTQAP